MTLKTGVMTFEKNSALPLQIFFSFFPFFRKYIKTKHIFDILISFRLHFVQINASLVRLRHFLSFIKKMKMFLPPKFRTVVYNITAISNETNSSGST